MGEQGTWKFGKYFYEKKKTTSATNEDSDQPAHSRSLISLRCSHELLWRIGFSRSSSENVRLHGLIGRGFGESAKRRDSE